MPLGETIVALATPTGESAIAIIRLSGSLCPSLVSDIFQKPKLPRFRQCTLGTYRNKEGLPLDKVVYTLFSPRRSYTGEDLLEISCHGNPFIIQKILEDLIRRGAKPAGPGEFTRTAFLQGKMDLSQAEAVADLIRARSDKALWAAQQQLAGALGERTNAFSQEILSVLAHVEAYIDFPDDSLPPEDNRKVLDTLQSLISQIQELIKTHQYRPLLQEGIQTVILGAPNAGKSSLLNTLIGQERVIVSPEPGTTRDFICEPITVGPYLLQVTDTAGLPGANYHPSGIEQQGIAKTLEKIQTADLHLFMVDQSEPPPLLPAPVMAHLRPSHTLLIKNKIDLPPPAAPVPFLPEFPHISLSLKTREGMRDFFPKLIALIENGALFPTENTLIVSTRHAHALITTREALESSVEKIHRGEPAELVSHELRLALDSLGEITGKVDNEAMLDKLFSQFCIGK